MTARAAGMLAAILVGMAWAPAAAQSLGDVARQEHARRERITAPTKVLTNADLPASAVAPPAAAATPREAPEGSAAEGAAGESESRPAGPAAPAPPADDEAGWKARAAQVNGKYAEAQAAARLLKALSDRLGLEMQASNPAIAQRASVERAEVKARLVDAEQKEAAALEAQQAFQREARASGVPPAWIQ